MPLLNDAMLTHVRRGTNASMLDLCHILRDNGGGDSVSRGEYRNGAWIADIPSIACGVDISGVGENTDGSQSGDAEIRIRFPVGTDISSLNRVGIVSMRGRTLAAWEIYNIVGPVQNGATGLIAKCKLAVGNSV